MSEPLVFTFEDGITRPIANVSELDEMEKTSLGKYYDKVVQELRKNPKSFTNIKALRITETIAFNLSAELVTNLKKGLLNCSEELLDIAHRFLKNEKNGAFSYWGIMKEVEKKPDMLKNQLFTKTLIQAAEDCVESAYQLALHRSHSRKNENIEVIKETNIRIDTTTVGIDQRSIRMEKQLSVVNQNLSKVMAKIGLNDQVQEPIEPLENMVQQNIRSPVATQPFVIPAPPNNATKPLWIVSEKECVAIINSGKIFEREFLLKLCTNFELLLPLKEFSIEKRDEFRLVLHYFFPTKADWEQIFTIRMSSLQQQKRHAVFKMIEKPFIGYAENDNGDKCFFELSICANTKCFNIGKSGRRSPIKNTKALGNMRIPESWNNFNYVILIEKKPHHNGKITKISQDGSITSLQ